MKQTIAEQKPSENEIMNYKVEFSFSDAQKKNENFKPTMLSWIYKAIKHFIYWIPLRLKFIQTVLIYFNICIVSSHINKKNGNKKTAMY